MSEKKFYFITLKEVNSFFEISAFILECMSSPTNQGNSTGPLRIGKAEREGAPSFQTRFYP